MKNNIYVSKYLKNNAITSERKNIYRSKYLDMPKKTGLNEYFSFNDETYDTSNEVELVKKLQQEQIKMYGYMCTYILRTNNTMDDVYGESIGSTFKHSFRIEMIPEDSTAVAGGSDSLMAFGYSMNDTITLYASMDRVKEEIAKLDVEGRTVPKVGDLIYMDIHGKLFEIRFVEDESPTYAKGTWTTYGFICQAFNLGQETFDTDDKDLDFLNHFEETYEYENMDNEKIHEEAKESIHSEPNTWDLDFSGGVDYNGKE